MKGGDHMTRLTRFITRILRVVVRTGSFVISGGFAPVRAERSHGYERDRYYSPHRDRDIRYRHDHFSPARGYVVPALPPGYVDLTLGGQLFSCGSELASVGEGRALSSSNLLLASGSGFCPLRTAPSGLAVRRITLRTVSMTPSFPIHRSTSSSHPGRGMKLRCHWRLRPRSQLRRHRPREAPKLHQLRFHLTPYLFIQAMAKRKAKS